MRKIHYLLLTAVAAMLAFTACHKEPEQPDDPNLFGKFKVSEVVAAADAAYKTWTDTEAFPETFSLGDKSATIAQYQNAICQALVSISAGKNDDIEVKTCKPADHPERDSYDKETIAIANGPKNGDETEDLVNVATRMLQRMSEELKVPNQTNFTRNGSPIAFSTDRATTVISRVLSSYKAAGKLPESVDAGYKGAGSSIKAFAKEYVKILDVWESNVGTINRLSNWELAKDGDTDVVENAHYVPNDFTIQLGEQIFNTADMFEIALRSYLLLRGLDGNDTDAVGFGTFPAVTPVNMNANIPATHQFLWNKPLIESSNGGYLYKIVDGFEVYGQVDPVILDNWAQRSLNWTFGNDMMITNFCSYPRDPITNYGGIFSSGRALLTYAFFFKYMLDNNLDKADQLDESVVIRSELFGLETAGAEADIQLKTAELEFDCTESAKEATFASKVDWTATPSDSWITVEPASGAKGNITVNVKVAENTGDAREGKVVIKGGNVTDGLEIIVKQAKFVAPSQATIMDFAREYVKILDIWANTVGTIDYLTGEDVASGTHPVENAHYVPMATTILVGEKTYTMGDMWETALRSYLLIRGYNGLETEKYGAGSIAALDGGAQSMSQTIVPGTHDYYFGSFPYAEPSNKGWLGRKEGDAKVYGKVDVAILDNFAMRALNYQKGRSISNMCDYPRDPINNYEGTFSAMRSVITFAFFFKYMLDNGLDKADGIAADVDIRSELFGVETASEAVPTILDFAKEYVKILNIWENTTGTIDQVNGENYQGGSYNVENAHYIPSGYSMLIGNKSYNTADIWEMALRSYLLIRGFDGLDTKNYGAGKIPALNGGAMSMSETPLPETHNYLWGANPFNETSSNGGHLVKKDGDKEIHCQVDPVILDNWAQRSLNFTFDNNMKITNMCTYPRSPIDNYSGSFCSQRALITYAFFFKHMLDKGYDKGSEVADDVIIRSELFGDEGGSQPEPAASIKIDGDLSDWDAIEGVSNGTFGSFKAASDDKNLYFYCYRTTEGRFSDIWGGTGYIYVGFNLDNDPSNNTAKLWASEAYDLLLLVYPYGGSAAAPAITEAAGSAGGCEPSPCTVANVVCKGVVDNSGAKIEFSIPRADISAIPSSAITITAWGNKDLAKVELNCTL